MVLPLLRIMDLVEEERKNDDKANNNDEAKGRKLNWIGSKRLVVVDKNKRKNDVSEKASICSSNEKNPSSDSLVESLNSSLTFPAEKVKVDSATLTSALSSNINTPVLQTYPFPSPSPVLCSTSSTSPTPPSPDSTILASTSNSDDSTNYSKDSDCSESISYARSKSVISQNNRPNSVFAPPDVCHVVFKKVHNQILVDTAYILRFFSSLIYY
jgi:hypothetical protein